MPSGGISGPWWRWRGISLSPQACCWGSHFYLEPTALGAEYGPPGVVQHHIQSPTWKPWCKTTGGEVTVNTDVTCSLSPPPDTSPQLEIPIPQSSSEGRSHWDHHTKPTCNPVTRWPKNVSKLVGSGNATYIQSVATIPGCAYPERMKYCACPMRFTDGLVMEKGRSRIGTVQVDHGHWCKQRCQKSANHDQESEVAVKLEFHGGDL
jgi:hypothetical protein